MCFLFKILACRGFNFTTTHTSDLVFDEESAPQDCAFMPWYWSINSSCFPVWLRQGHIPCVQSSPWLPYILNIPFKQILPMCILQCVGLFGIPNWRCWCLMLLVAINCKPQSSCFRTPHLPTNVLPPHSKVLHEFVSYNPPPLPTHTPTHTLSFPLGWSALVVLLVCLKSMSKSWQIRPKIHACLDHCS